jgi:hypothetical protein
MAILCVIGFVLLFMYGLFSMIMEGTCDTFKDTIKSWAKYIVCILIAVMLIGIPMINNSPKSETVSLNSDSWNGQKFDQVMHIEYTINRYPWNTFGYFFDNGKHNILISKYDSINK